MTQMDLFAALDEFYEQPPPRPAPEPPAPRAPHLCQHVGAVTTSSGGWTLETAGVYAGRWVHGSPSCRKPGYDPK